jgi:hypothetical protein
MPAERVPDVPRRYVPEGGSRPQSGPAWSAAWELLSDGENHHRTEVIATMRKASPISYRTARELLTLAVKEEVLTVVERDRYGRPTLKRST